MIKLITKFGNGPKIPSDQSEKMSQTSVGRIYGKGKF